MKRIFISIALILAFICVELLANDTRLLRFPNASETHITFSYGGDIYVVPIEGGLARRVTSSPGLELFPRISPDGKTIAFTAEYDGNTEIYTIPIIGGEPNRLTYSMDIPNLKDRERMGPAKVIMQWTADGEQVLYRARNEVWNAMTGKLYLVSKNGGLPEALPLPRAGFANFSPDGNKLAYNRVYREFRPWKRYRGGQADDIWIYDFQTKQVDNIVNNPAQDIIPIWHGNKVYYVSDRDHTANLFCYNFATKQTKKVTNFSEFDVKFPSFGKRYITFENGGYVYLLDPATDEYKRVSIQVAEDNLWARTSIVKVNDKINSYDIHPDAQRGLIVARGDVFTVPAKEGITYNLTKTSGVHDRNATYSPDGKWIAYISDESGEFEIYIIKPDGSDKTKLTSNAESYRYSLLWSPDSKKIICSDKMNKLYYIDIETKKITNIARSQIFEITNYTWSPDSKWIAYTDYVNNYTPVIKLYSIETGKSQKITDEFFECHSPEFSVCGKYIFFVSNRTFSPTVGAFEWNFQYHNLAKIYGYTLQKSLKSPFAFTEENQQADKKDAEKIEPIKIDFEGIENRIFEFPVAAGNYGNLRSVDNKLYYSKMVSGSGQSPALMVFDLEKKEEAKVADISNYAISPDGKNIMYIQSTNIFITPLTTPLKMGDGKLNLDNMEMELDRRAEWAQIYDEVWRQMRDFLYDANMHGYDWEMLKKRYEVLLPYVTHRFCLTYILAELISELNVGHAYVGGGEMPTVDEVQVGKLGARFELDKNSGFYRITKIFEGRNWEEKTRSPFTEPGIDVKVGDYLIAIDGKNLNAENHPFKALVNKANKFVTVKVNSSPRETGAREYTIKTIETEKDLIYLDWVETNRRTVDKATNGRVGYVHIPDMSFAGLNEFVKYFYPQVRKEALIVDDRYNGGGNVSPMIIERLRRILVVAKNARNQEQVFTTPSAVMTGPMVCLINQISASDGDLFPYQFKKMGLGPIIGMRSWGGVIGIRGSLPLLDGGYLNKPEFANFGADGTWVLEGVGMEPDIEIENDPAKEYSGIDEQLNKAIEVILDEIEKCQKPKIPTVPSYPDKSK